jgi:AAHS family 4-hydroxybenzoate transporter-like MFS transporter
MSSETVGLKGGRIISIGEVFDTSQFTSYQLLVCGLCFLVTFLDGFDLTVIGVALPKMADFLHVKPSALGLALSAGQFGPLIGAIVLGTLADRFGRKWMLFISALIFGVFTLMTAFVTSVEQLALFRFLGGLGLGGAIPNALTFGSEYAPARSRATFVTTMYAGMPAGSVLGALSAVFLLPNYGWQSLFLLGGATPIVIALAVALLLPESLEFMAQKGKNRLQVRKIISRIAPALAADENVEFRSTAKKLPGVPVKHLFTEGRAWTTILLWIALIGSLYSLWVLVSWAPTLLKRSGASIQQYSLAFACLHFGAFVATITFGRVMDKFNPFRVLMVGFAVGALSLAAFGLTAGGSFFIILVLSVVCGAFINGSNAGLLAVATTFYPVDIRASGIGWAYAVAKVGAMLAPAAGGFLLTQNLSVSRICGYQAVVGLFVAALLMLLHGRAKRLAAVTTGSEEVAAQRVSAGKAA